MHYTRPKRPTIKIETVAEREAEIKQNSHKTLANTADYKT